MSGEMAGFLSMSMMQAIESPKYAMALVKGSTLFMAHRASSRISTSMACAKLDLSMMPWVICRR
ncbi:hypothetical protein A4F85_07290 [Delftia sp. GW456-R20]|nr:hypothetical protein A4F85_07290 [Delftia sp. GW456-R20]